MSEWSNQEWLANKFQEIQRRMIRAIEQLSEEQLNWKPNEASLSIANLVKHIEGNILERIEKGILQRTVSRNREEEFASTPMAKRAITAIIQERFDTLIHTVRHLSEEDLSRTQLVRNKERLNVDMLHQCAAHYSEHMGQIFYIAKQCLNDRYKSTSI